MVFSELSSVGAVTAYGLSSQILLMISPPPYGIDLRSKKIMDDKKGNLIPDLPNFCDYYACYDFIELYTGLMSKHKLNEPKYIIFIGNLGGSDGSMNMYSYLMNHPNLSLVKRKLLPTYHQLSEHEDGRDKELFIFKLYRSDTMKEYSRVGELDFQQGTVYVPIIFSKTQIDMIHSYVHFNFALCRETAKNGIHSPVTITRNTRYEDKLLVCVEQSGNLWLVTHLLNYLVEKKLLSTMDYESILKEAKNAVVSLINK